MARTQAAPVEQEWAGVKVMTGAKQQLCAITSSSPANAQIRASFFCSRNAGEA